MTLALSIDSVLNESRDPTTIIAWSSGQAFTLHQFRHAVLALIHQLSALPGNRCALYFEDSYFFAVALFASLYSGKTPILLGHLKSKKLAEQVHTFDIVLTDIAAISTTKPVIHVHQGMSKEVVNLPILAKDLSLILFTSGSTGIPKPICKPIVLLEKEVHLLIEHLLADQLIELVIATVSHQHLYGLTFKVLLPLLSGIPFESKKVQYHEQLCLYPEGALLVASPAFLKRLDSNLPSKAFAMILSGGGPLTYDEAQHVKHCLFNLPREIYGSSETGVIASRRQCYKNQPWLNFPPIKIVPTSDGAVVYSPLCGVLSVVLSDTVELLDNGFHLLGRKDRVIKIEEKRVSLSEVEERLKALPNVVDAAVIVLDQSSSFILGACLVLSVDGQSELSDLGRYALFQCWRQTLKEVLEFVAIPKKWRVINELPYNERGKMCYDELERLFK